MREDVRDLCSPKGVSLLSRPRFLDMCHCCPEIPEVAASHRVPVRPAHTLPYSLVAARDTWPCTGGDPD
jgi:hypothetical protein